MDLLTFITHLFGATARLGAAIAIGGFIIVKLKQWNVEPFVNISPSAYIAIYVAVIIGACTVAVEFMVSVWTAIKKLIIALGIPYLESRLERQMKRKTALNNLEAGGTEFIKTLFYLATLRWMRRQIEWIAASFRNGRFKMWVIDQCICR
jgi:hypothetical protein